MPKIMARYTTTRTDTLSEHYAGGQYAIRLYYKWSDAYHYKSATRYAKVHPVDGKFDASIEATDIDSSVVWLSIKKMVEK